jgi:hypothetical protein
VTLRALWVTLRARWVTLRAHWVTLRARWVTLRAHWVTLRAHWVTLRARWVTLRARWVTLRAHWVTLRALWVTLRAHWVTLRARGPPQLPHNRGVRARSTALVHRMVDCVGSRSFPVLPAALLLLLASDEVPDLCACLTLVNQLAAKFKMDLEALLVRGAPV